MSDQDLSPGTVEPSEIVVDDFAEFLDESYAPLIDVLIEAGLSARVERVRQAEYALTVRSETGRMVDVTAGGRPLPASPHDVSRWQLLTGGSVEILPGSLPLAEVASRIVRLL